MNICEGASVQYLRSVAAELQNATQKPGSRRAKRSRRLSLNTRLLFRRAYNATDPGDRKLLLLQARASRRMEFQDCRLVKLCDLLSRGKVVCRSSPLHSIQAVRRPDGQKATSDAESVALVASAYREKMVHSSSRRSWCFK